MKAKVVFVGSMMLDLDEEIINQAEERGVGIWDAAWDAVAKIIPADCIEDIEEVREEGS